MYHSISARLNAISFTLITFLCALLPLFILPASLGGVGAVKGVVLYTGVLLSFSLWIVSQFINGNLKLLKNWIFVFLGGVAVFSLVSAIASGNTTLALWGRGFSLDSFSSIAILSLFAFLVAVFSSEQHYLIRLFLAAFIGSVLTVLTQVLLFAFKGTPLVLSHFSHVASQGTLVGSWVDFSHFVTFTFVLSVLMFEVLMPRGFFRWLSLFSAVLALAVLAFLNFKVAWIITVVSALIVFVYKISVERSIFRLFSKKEDRDESFSVDDGARAPRFPFLSFASLLVGLFFLLSSATGARLAQMAQLNFADIRPSFASTMHVARATLSHNPIFGAGAGRFADQWNLYHTTDVNRTLFWNTSFDMGFSWLTTIITTNGVVVSLLFLLVLITAIIHGFKLFNYQYPDQFSRFIAVTALIVLIAFTVLIALSSPGMVLVAYGFMYLGFLMGVSALVGKTKYATFDYLNDPRSSFFAILVLVLAAMVGFSSIYFTINRFTGIVSYQKAIAATDFASAEGFINKAIARSDNDLFWRMRAALYAKQFTAEAAKTTPDKAQMQIYFTQVEQSAQSAVAWSRASAGNWLALSQIYRLVASGNSDEAYNNAKTAAEEAQKRNPNNPAFILNQAQVALSHQDVTGANTFIDKALALKADYLDAFLLRAQIKGAQGDNQGVRTELQKYIAVAPFDPQGYVLFGNAELEMKNYQSALDAFARARSLATDPSIDVAYINTLLLLGRKSDAVTELQLLKEKYPQITGIDELVERTKNGTSGAATSEGTTPVAEENKEE
ncbi:hypothetical protein IT401_01040 [Candidatus Nomurabacteria bacterium]|nr:hypothetical protein [Candidatus Nomurabacteria bacterium]